MSRVQRVYCNPPLYARVLETSANQRKDLPTLHLATRAGIRSEGRRADVAQRAPSAATPTP
jgi:hypothetical protein